ncbi:MAG: hypothetical protein M0Z84_06250 [Gammaproteobacteria bacterium]|nr:hypothetical protein [Gammaproteobacteria bacterium]
MNRGNCIPHSPQQAAFSHRPLAGRWCRPDTSGARLGLRFGLSQPDLLFAPGIRLANAGAAPTAYGL